MSRQHCVHVDGPEGYGARVYANGYCLTLHGQPISAADVKCSKGLQFVGELNNSVAFAARDQGWSYTERLALLPTLS